MNGWSFKRAETSLPVGRLCEIIFCTHKRVVGREEGGEAGDAARRGGGGQTARTRAATNVEQETEERASFVSRPSRRRLFGIRHNFSKDVGGGVSGTEHGLRSCPNRMLSSTCAPDLLFHICSVLYPPPTMPCTSCSSLPSYIGFSRECCHHP